MLFEFGRILRYRQDNVVTWRRTKPQCPSNKLNHTYCMLPVICLSWLWYWAG